MNAVFNYQELFLPIDFEKYGTSAPLPNTKQFSVSESSDYDRNVIEVILLQEFNKNQWKDFTQKLRLNTLNNIGHCGHEWDCCGCLCGQSMDYEYLKKGVFKVTFSQSFNY